MERISQLTIGVSGFAERVAGTPIKESDWTDVAKAMARCTKEEAALVRAIYLHEVKACRYVVEALAKGAARIEASKPLSRDLAFATLKAFIGMQPCEHCEARGWYMTAGGAKLVIETGEWIPYKGGRKTCELCKGDGYSHVKPDAVRQIMGVSAQVWEMLLAPSFTDTYEQLREWHKKAEGKISASLQSGRSRGSGSTRDDQSHDRQQTDSD